MLKASKNNNNIVLKRILYIHYLFYFYKNKKIKIQAPINFNYKINAITLTYVTKLGFKICHINVKAQKINSCIFKIFRIILTSFQVKD